MSLWGNRDSKTVAGSVTVTAANSTVVGVGTTLTNFAVGDFLHVGENDYVFTAIANATVATVRSATGGALVGAQSNSSYVVSEKPLYITYSQNIDADTVYGASTAELSGTSGVASVTITNAGSDYDGTPTVTFSAPPSGVTATGTATVAANAVTAVVMTNNGSGYVTAPTVTFSGANTTSDIATGTAVLQTSERDAVTHSGWVVRTEGTGGRAGRVQYETLVAMSSIQGDAEDDAQLPE